MADRPSVLIVEDEPELREILTYHLGREGFRVLVAEDGWEGLQLARREQPAIVLLDVMLPGLNGWEVCRELRGIRGSTHIIIISARNAEADVLQGLDLGADDYIRKPFRLKEVVARMRTVLRRAKSPASGESRSDALHHPPLRLDDSAHEVTLDGQPVTLTATEYTLLHFLMRQPGRIFTRQQLLAQMSDRMTISGRTIDVHIRALRRKLGLAAPMIETARGVGYYFSPQPSGEPAGLLPP